jgi:Rrf2 family protein
MAELASRTPARVSAREIAEHTHLPLPVLTNILHQLLHHGLVTSTMGVKGGYCLARPASQITLAEVIDAIEGPFRLALCCSEEAESAEQACDLEKNCRIKEPVRRVHTSLRQFLAQITLAQLMVGEASVSLTISAGPRGDAAGTALSPAAAAHGA